MYTYDISNLRVNLLFFSNVKINIFQTFINRLFTLNTDFLPLQYKLRKFVFFAKNLSSIYVLQNFHEVLSSIYGSVF